MTGELRRLVALAATLAPARAVRLVGRLGDPGGGEAVRQAGVLAGAPRRVRLAALASSLADDRMASQPHAGSLPTHPLLRRLEAERRGRPTADPTRVRAAVDPSGPVRPDTGRLGRHGA